MIEGPGSSFVSAHGACARMEALASDLVRIRLARSDQDIVDGSWAVSAAFRGARDPAAKVVDTGTGAALRTDTLTVQVATTTLAVSVEDEKGRTILGPADGGSPGLLDHGFALRWAMNAGERYFALGDKTGPLDRRGQRFINWATDQNVTETSDPLYKAIPFVLAAGSPAGCWGLLVDCSWRLTFDFGATENDVLSVEADDGAVDLYFIVGASVGDVVRRYADLTGHPPMPPKWSFGYHQSRYSYMSAEEVRAVAARLRDGRFPADVIWLDIGFQDRNRPFTVDPVGYPDLPALVADLHERGFATVAITDLHIAAAPNEGYRPYDGGIAADVFLRAADGAIYTGEVWPGPVHFPDFAREDVRRWWGELYRDFVEKGIDGFWVDMNEPSVFDGPGKTIPSDIVHRIGTTGFAERPAAEAEMHNLTGLLNSQATFEGLVRLRPDVRPFVMTRSTFAGGQKWAVTWTGDNDATWSQLELGVRQTLSLGLSGFAFTAVDVGGFLGEPSAELLTRWFQVVAFMPLFRDHTAEGTPAQEPWVHGPAHEAIRRRYVEERYRLMPTLYALAAEAHETGAPIVRPVFFDDVALLAPPEGTAATFRLGDDVLIAVPPSIEAAETFTVALPRGRWFDYWTDDEIATQAFQEPSEAFVAKVEAVRLDHLPVYVRAGAILVRQALVQSLSETPDGPLELHVWAGAKGRTTLYDDDGRSTAYLAGGFLRQEVECHPVDGGMALHFADRRGSFAPSWTEIQITIHGWNAPTARAETAEGTSPAEVDAGRRTASITLRAPREISLLRLLA